MGEAIPLMPADGLHSFHLHADEHAIIQQVFKAYGIDTMIDDSVRAAQVHFDVDDVKFADAMRVLSLATNSFYVPIDGHHVLVARDTRDNRLQFSRQLVETVYLSGLSDTEMTEVHNLARTVFGIQTGGAAGTTGTGPAQPAAPVAPRPATPGATPADDNDSRPARRTAFCAAGDNDQYT